MRCCTQTRSNICQCLERSAECLPSMCVACKAVAWPVPTLELCTPQQEKAQYDAEDPRRREKEYPFAKQTQSNPGDEYKCAAQPGSCIQL